MKYQVKVNGAVVGTRKSDRSYSHALVGLQVAVSTYDAEREGEVVVKPVEPRWVVCSFHASAALAEKAAGAEYLTGDKKLRTFLRERRSSFEKLLVVPVEGVK